VSPIVAGILLLTLWPPASTADWIRVDTPHFVVYGPAGEKQTRAIASEFERFRAAIGQMMPVAVVDSPVPTVVVLFEDERSFAPFVPHYNGKPIGVDGFFQGTETDNVIALSLAKRESALRIIFHEYTHLVISGMTLPAWVNEGLAEYYSTFEMREDGRGGISGRPIPAHLRLLYERPLLKVDELLEVQRDSPLYNEGDRRSVFYAQSWGFVHMLLSDSGRYESFKRYLQLTSQGTSSRDAWRQAFGTFDAVTELKSYIRTFSMTGFSYRFDEIKSTPMTTSTPSAAEIETAMAILLRRSQPENAQSRLEKVTAGKPTTPLALAVLGLMVVDSNSAGAERMLLEASRDTADWLSQYYAAAGLAQLVSGSTLESERPRTTAARAALKAVMTARPELAHPHALLAFVSEPEESIASAAKARRMAPGRADYVYLEAQARANDGQFAPARELLAPLLTPAHPREVRDRAGELMAKIARRERSEPARPTIQEPAPAQTPPAPGRAVRVDEQGSGTPPAQSSPEKPIRVDEHTPGRPRTLYRVTQRGETRVEGRLTRIVCARSGAVTFDIRVDGAIQHFSARALRDVEFVTYREASPGAITCGIRTPPERVFLTWRPWSPAVRNIVGRVVAVELLPEK
jgi:hypothetical protein